MVHRRWAKSTTKHQIFFVYGWGLGRRGLNWHCTINRLIWDKHRSGSTWQSSLRDQKGLLSVRQTSELFQRQFWGNFWEMKWSAYICMGFSGHVDPIPSWSELKGKLNWPEDTVLFKSGSKNWDWAHSSPTPAWLPLVQSSASSGAWWSLIPNHIWMLSYRSFVFSPV